MKSDQPTHDYLVISRGQWDAAASEDDIQSAIDEFYRWLQRCVDEGTMRKGSRLAIEGATVTKAGIVMDGPYGEAKEAIGGTWTIVARNLQEAAALAARNPCLDHGLFFEIRLMDPECAAARSITVESPRAAGATSW